MPPCLFLLLSACRRSLIHRFGPSLFYLHVPLPREFLHVPLPLLLRRDVAPCSGTPANPPLLRLRRACKIVVQYGGEWVTTDGGNKMYNANTNAEMNMCQEITRSNNWMSLRGYSWCTVSNEEGLVLQNRKRMDFKEPLSYSKTTQYWNPRDGPKWPLVGIGQGSNSPSVLALTYGGNIEDVYGFVVAELARLVSIYIYFGGSRVACLASRSRRACSPSWELHHSEKFHDDTNFGATNIYDVLATPNHMRSSIVSVSLFGEVDDWWCTTVASMWTLWSTVDVMMSESVGTHESNLIVFSPYEAYMAPKLVGSA
ncbi:hypothetical protein Syun_002053 [Stephania yunnanensis]|uniref:Uncharacterized protein n=1 Tax=Stephania yunnanensis TaxID=152371 RepID=A0AAP0Q7P9_9MAGN